MFLCLCKQITDKQFEEKRQENPDKSLKEICVMMGLGRQCSPCIEGFLEKMDPNRESGSCKAS